MYVLQNIFLLHNNYYLSDNNKIRFNQLAMDMEINDGKVKVWTHIVHLYIVQWKYLRNFLKIYIPRRYIESNIVETYKSLSQMISPKYFSAIGNQNLNQFKSL